MIKVYAGITLRRGEGIHFGTMVRLGGARAGITTDAIYAAGDFLEFQLELTGWNQTVAGIAEIRKADHRAPRLNRYLLRILEMGRTDRRNLQAWYKERGTQQVSSREANRPRALDSTVGSHMPPKAVRLQHRPPQPDRPRPTPGQPGTAWSTDGALSISQSVEQQGSRRDALRAVLRAAYGDPLPATAQGSEAPCPIVTVTPGSTATKVTLRYDNVAAWRRDWDAWLHQGLAFAPLPDHGLELEATIAVRLRFPGKVDVGCPGKVVVLHPSGFGLALDLDPDQLENMRDLGGVAPGSQLPLRARFGGPEIPSPLDRSFWIKLFGLTPASDPLEEAIAALVPPLASLDMQNPRDLVRLENILGGPEEDYLFLCDKVTALLAECQWRWPELEDLTRDASEPYARAAAYIVLAQVTRDESIEVLRRAARRSQHTPSLVSVAATDGGGCAGCRETHGHTTTPAALARRGLPPFHLGCRCRVQRVDQWTPST